MRGLEVPQGPRQRELCVQSLACRGADTPKGELKRRLEPRDGGSVWCPGGQGRSVSRTW